MSANEGLYVPPLARELADKVRAGLRVNRRTQAMLARRVGVSQKHVSRVLTGYDDGSVPFWDAMLREAWAAPDPELDKGNRAAWVCPTDKGSTPVSAPARNDR